MKEKKAMIQQNTTPIIVIVIALASMLLLANSYAVADSVPADTPEGETLTKGTGESVEEITIMLPGDIPLVMAKLSAGALMMGCYPDEKNSLENESPQHEVALKYDFYLGKYEITQEQWKAVMNTSPSYFIGDKLPVEQVSWDNTQDFLVALNKIIESSGQERISMRLPTEGEWEYACRSGTKTSFFWSNKLSDGKIDAYAWYESNSREMTNPVGRKRSNEFGLCDLSGNVWEWCEDDWHTTYHDAPNDGSAWISTPRTAVRVLRGGSWNDFDWVCRSSTRIGYNRTVKLFNLGFRVAATKGNDDNVQNKK